MTSKTNNQIYGKNLKSYEIGRLWIMKESDKWRKIIKEPKMNSLHNYGDDSSDNKSNNKNSKQKRGHVNYTNTFRSQKSSDRFNRFNNLKKKKCVTRSILYVNDNDEIEDLSFDICEFSDSDDNAISQNSHYSDDFDQNLSVTYISDSELEPKVTELEPIVTETETEPKVIEPKVTELEPKITELEPETEPKVIEPKVTELQPKITELESEPKVTELEPKVTELEPKVTKNSFISKIQKYIEIPSEFLDKILKLDTYQCINILPSVHLMKNNLYSLTDIIFSTEHGTSKNLLKIIIIQEYNEKHSYKLSNHVTDESYQLYDEDGQMLGNCKIKSGNILFDLGNNESDDIDIFGIKIYL